MILAENNVVFPNSDSKITINTYNIRLGQKLRMLPSQLINVMYVPQGENGSTILPFANKPGE